MIATMTLCFCRCRLCRHELLDRDGYSPLGGGLRGVRRTERPEFEHPTGARFRRNGIQAGTPGGDRKLPDGSEGTTQMISPVIWPRGKTRRTAAPDSIEIHLMGTTKPARIFAESRVVATDNLNRKDRLHGKFQGGCPPYS